MLAVIQKGDSLTEAKQPSEGYRFGTYYDSVIDLKRIKPEVYKEYSIRAELKDINNRIYKSKEFKLIPYISDIERS